VSLKANLPSPSLSTPTLAALLARTPLPPDEDPGAHVLLSDFHGALSAQDLCNIAVLFGEVHSCQVRRAFRPSQNRNSLTCRCLRNAALEP
jgi:hypothetical protein